MKSHQNPSLSPRKTSKGYWRLLVFFTPIYVWSVVLGKCCIYPCGPIYVRSGRGEGIDGGGVSIVFIVLSMGDYGRRGVGVKCYICSLCVSCCLW
jgi:hypothetical protein